ncbi:SGNH/GDSL hydrolase family protein [Candidatus Woesearchaeota archaeon]|nr:SGNH/GDSL hydrolase family protein [Candidatus Woesearchaeota archaeon]
MTLNILPNKKFALNACVLVISILLSLFVLEILFKIYLPQKLSITGGEDLHFPHNTLGWFTKPNLSTQIVGENLYLTNIKHNSLGLRSDRELGEKTKKRILLFGDSFIYGLGLDWNETLDYFFQKELGENFQVINAGVTGYGMLQEYLLFKELYDKINPDLIIIAIYSNDFKDNIFPKLTGSVRPIATKGLNFSIVEKINQFGGGLDVVKRKNEYFFVFSKIFENLREFFKRHSNFYQFLYKNRFKFTQIKEESYRGDFSFFTNKQNEITNFAFSTECKLSEIFTSLAKEKSTKYLFLYIPSRLEIEENTVRPTFDGYYDLSMNELNLNRIINELHNCFEKNNETNFLSLKDKFLEEKTGMYNTHGNHWSPKATNLTAQLLKEELFKRGLINISEIKSS